MTKECRSRSSLGKQIARQRRFTDCVRSLALLGVVATHILRADAAMPKPCTTGPLREGSTPLIGPGRVLLLPRLPCVGEPSSPGSFEPPSRRPVSETVPPEMARVLTGMAAQAAVIFTGQVRSIIREDAHGYVDISFTVLQALRGTSATVYVLREWSGLWIGQPERYRVGERVLLLLRSRSRSGFSSPVGGLDGAIPILSGSLPPLGDATSQIPADPGKISQSALDPASMRVDLRWIATRVQRTPVASWGRAFSALPRGSAADSTLAEVPLPAVLAVLQAAPEDSFNAR